MSVKDWSITAASNATADADEGITFSEGQAPASLNDSMRAMMAVIRTDFAQFVGASSGYQKLPNGLIIQWGISVGAASDYTVTYPIPFPTATVIVVVSPYEAPPATALWSATSANPTASSFTIHNRYATNGGVVGQATLTTSWIALGI